MFAKFPKWLLNYADKYPLIQKQMNFGDPTDQAMSNWLEQHSQKPLVHLITYIGFGFLSLLFAHNPTDNGFWEV